MTTPSGERPVPSRRGAFERARRSRRPSRLGALAGHATGPDRERPDNAGFPGLLARTWHKAVAAADPRESLLALLTLDGHVPADIQLRALRSAEECAVRVLYGLSWRLGANGAGLLDTEAPTSFLGEIGLTAAGRVALRMPGEGPLAPSRDLVDGVLRVPWSREAVHAYRREADRARERYAEQVADCRDWLERVGADGRAEILRTLEQAALRTAPFVLYHEDRSYTNFRDHNTLPGKTLWPGHPDCVLTGLRTLPLELWSDADAMVVVAMHLLVRSSGFGRIEEANGTQLTLDHVALLLERTRARYSRVRSGPRAPAAPSNSVRDLDTLAADVRARRSYLMESGAATLYRQINGPLMHKTELIAGSRTAPSLEREKRVHAELSARVPLAGASLDEMFETLVAAPESLAKPHGGFETGLESLIFQTVSASAAAFEADFAMSRGMRSLPRLVDALRARDWPRICAWELPDYFCCVVPSPGAAEHFGGDPQWVADAAWAMSARMQYNSWHFIAGNLPKNAQVEARDYFVPPTMPDLAFHSDQHHHGHLAAKVRFSIRSPQAVEVAGHRFGGFVDLRLLRCAGPPFTEQDLLAAQRVSAFVARVTTLATRLAEAGTALEVTAFDSDWHAKTIIGGGSALTRQAESAAAHTERTAR